MCFLVYCEGAAISMHSHVMIDGPDGGHQPLAAKQVHGGLVVKQDVIFEVYALPAGPLDVAKFIINRIVIIRVIVQGVALSENDSFVGLLLALSTRA